MITPFSSLHITDYQACCRRLLKVLTESVVGRYRVFLHDLRAGSLLCQTVTTAHAHLGDEVFMVLDGAMVFHEVNGREIALDVGNILIVPHQLRHATYRTESNCLSITLRFFTDPPLQPALPLLAYRDPLVMQEVCALLVEADNQHAGWQERASHRLTVLLSLLLSNAMPAETYTEAPISPTGVLQQVDAYLQQHLTHPVTLTDIANVLDMSVRSLIRHFKAHAGHTVMERLLALRMETADNLLVERPDLSIKQIAAMVGFPDHAYFSNCFRRRMGMSPQQNRLHARHTLLAHELPAEEETRILYHGERLIQAV